MYVRVIGYRRCFGHDHIDTVSLVLFLTNSIPEKVFHGRL